MNVRIAMSPAANTDKMVLAYLFMVCWEKKEWEKNGVLARLHSRMKRDKTLNSALEKVTLKEVMVDRKDLIADN